MRTDLRIEWELTSACALACPDCSSRRVSRGRDLDLTSLMEIADRLVVARVALVSLSGGEPLGHPGWEVVVRRLSAGGIEVQVLTSGAVWDSDTAARLRAAGVGRVWLGMDGAGEAHDRFRGRPGLFAQVCRAMDELEEAGVPAGAFTTVRARTAAGIPALARWIRGRGVADWFLWASVGEPVRGAGFSRAAVERAAAQVTAAGTRVWYGDTWHPGEVACGAGETVLGVAADGQVRGCLLQLDAPGLGHVLETELPVLAARARMLRCAAGCTACAGTRPAAAGPGTWQRAALVPLAALALGGGACRSTESDSLPPQEPRSQAQPTQPVAEPEAKAPVEPETKAEAPVMRKMPPCCYSRALIRNCKCDWNTPVSRPPSTTP